MSTLAEIEAAAEQLPPPELKQLVQHLIERLEQRSIEPPKQRIAGMHAGAWKLAPDFDDSLPDEFWLGKDA